MKELTEKVVRAGIVDKSTVNLMKMWGMVDESVDLEKIAKTKEELTALVEEISRLLEKEGEVPELRETDLDLEMVMDSPVFATVAIRRGELYKCYVGLDRAGRVIFRRTPDTHAPEDLCAKPGVVIRIRGKDKEIVSVEPRYVGDKLKWYVCEVRTLS